MTTAPPPGTAARPAVHGSALLRAPATPAASPASVPRPAAPQPHRQGARWRRGRPGRYSGIDPLLWRVGFVALAFAGGTGILVYLLLWLLMPAAPAWPADGYGFARGRGEGAGRGPRSPVPGVTIAAVLIVVGVLALLTRLTGWTPGPRVSSAPRCWSSAWAWGSRPSSAAGRPAAAHRARRRPVTRPAVRVDLPRGTACAAASATAPTGRPPRPTCATCTAAAWAT